MAATRVTTRCPQCHKPLSIAQDVTKGESVRNSIESVRNSIEHELISAYARTLAKVVQCIEMAKLDEAKVLLAECPEIMRGWEWRHLGARIRGVGVRVAMEAVSSQAYREIIAVFPDGSHLLTRGSPMTTPPIRTFAHFVYQIDIANQVLRPVALPSLPSNFNQFGVTISRDGSYLLAYGSPDSYLKLMLRQGIPFSGWTVADETPKLRDWLRRADTEESTTGRNSRSIRRAAQDSKVVEGFNELQRDELKKVIPYKSHSVPIRIGASVTYDPSSVSPDQTRIAKRDRTNRVEIVHTATNTTLLSIRDGFDNRFMSERISWNADGQSLVIAGSRQSGFALEVLSCE